MKGVVSDKQPVPLGIVYLIHGTNAAKANDAGSAWWQRDSHFWKTLSDRLERSAQSSTDTPVFHWTGHNSEKHRNAAAQTLSREILLLEAKELRYHLIGHSHGGSVLWRALALAATKKPGLPNLGSWATVGTPFLSYVAQPLSIWWILPFGLAATYACLATGYVLTYLHTVPHAIHDPVGLSLWSFMLPIIWLGPLLVVAVSIFRMLRYCSCRIHVERESKDFGKAYRALHDRYLAVTASVDEAIGGLRSTIYASGAVVPRLSMKRESLWSRLVATACSPVLLVYNRVFAEASDEFIRERIRLRLQGNDLSGYTLVSVERRPHPVAPPWPELPPEVTTLLVEEANSHAARTLANVRDALGVATESRSPILMSLFSGSVEPGGLVHNLYFSSAAIIEALCLHIGARDRFELKSTTSEMKQWLENGKAAEVIADEVACSKPASRTKSSSVLAGLLAMGAILIVGGMWLLSDVLYKTYLMPFTDEYQVKNVLQSDVASRMTFGPDITTGKLKQWIRSMTRAGYAAQALSLCGKTNSNTNNLVCRASVVHELLTVGEQQQAKNTLAEAMQVAKSVQPDSDDRGFKELAEELAHAGQVDDAVTIVNRMAENVAVWNAEGVEQIADGLADAGRSNDALNILQRIPDEVQRAMEIRTFIHNRKDEEPVKAKAVEMLLKLAPNISDDHSWSSASLQEVASELDKAGDPRFLSVLQSIPRQDHRVNGLVAHMTSLAQRGRLDEAHALMNNPLLANHGNDMDLAVLIAGLPAKPTFPDPQGVATAMLVNAESDARKYRFFTAQSVGEVAKRWARLGNVQRCVDILDTTPDDFYRDMIYEPMKDSIEELVKRGKQKETQDAVARMKSSFRRSLAWTALAVQAETPQAQRALLLRAENDASQVLSDDDRSFAYSTAAQVWVAQHQYKHAVELGEKARSFDRISVYQALLDEDAKRRLNRSTPERSRN
jgi:hypothetical protein